MALRMQEEEEISMEEYEALLAAAAANQAEQVGLCPRQRYACVSLHRSFFLCTRPFPLSFHLALHDRQEPKHAFCLLLRHA